MFFCNMDARRRMREELSKIPGILVSSSIPNNLESNAAGADKGGADVYKRQCLISADDFEIHVSQRAIFSRGIRPFAGEIYGDQTDRSGYGWNAA